ncbi:MAG: hypothetical protein SFY81_02920 [Verrucomicrobiota bacterium]|nr:hypothetical protein [Verrucomicrobiota bacterium]
MQNSNEVVQVAGLSLNRSDVQKIYVNADSIVVDTVSGERLLLLCPTPDCMKGALAALQPVI